MMLALEKHHGNLTKVAESYDRSRTTIYLWIRQLGLAKVAQLPESLAWVNTQSRLDSQNTLDSESRLNSTQHTNDYMNKSRKSVQLLGDSRPRLGGVSMATATAAQDTAKPGRVTKAIRISPDLWRRARVRAAEEDREVSDVIESALELLLKVKHQ